MSISANDFIQENDGSDSDAISDDSPDYYQPISAVDDDDSDQEISIEGEGEEISDSGVIDFFSSGNPNFHSFSNGFVHPTENGISSLDLNSDGEAEETEERIREAAISRAFSEDENRRNAPLAPDNAVRVMEAMRGISFGGFMPDWTDRVPEDRWIDHLSRLRQSTTSTPQN